VSKLKLKGRSLIGPALFHLLVCSFVVCHDEGRSVARVRWSSRSLRSNFDVDDAA
jgi:hypothetical protein